MFNTIDIPAEALKDLCHDYSSEGEGLRFLDHSPQLCPGEAGGSPEEINPYGGVYEDQDRLRRIRLRLPFQMPLP